ncbi:MAG: hypothetical protein VKP62_01765 [Candidatus Sericytochromatia bacterium]|nr:hypothetical protein [Candidatus Sericytochromatia bacterium]
MLSLTSRPEAEAPQTEATGGSLRGLTPPEREALIRAVAAEARGESPAVWAGVAQTIINYARVNGQSIPRLVRSSYLSSNYDGNRRYFTMPLGQIPNLDGIQAAVDAAAEGRSPVGSRRIHFHDISITMPWFGKPSSALRMGRMVFFEAR